MEWEDVIGAMVIIVGLLVVIGSIATPIYFHAKLKYDNFQETIKDLDDEQKCMHICAFNYPSGMYLENYKFCIEKCDRISERNHECGELK